MSKGLSSDYARLFASKHNTVMPSGKEPGKTRILKIPAALACYWLGQGEATEVEE